MVTARAEEDDEVADGIVERGVAGLLASVDAVRPAAAGPVVLAGALLTHQGPVLAGVQAGLADPPLTADQPTVGAAWLALVSLGVTDEAVHATLSSRDCSTRPR